MENSKDKMKIISVFLRCAEWWRPSRRKLRTPVQQSSEFAARTAAGARADLSRHRGSPDHQGDQLQSPQRIDENRFPRHGASARGPWRGQVESKQGVIKIDARMDKLEPATMFGPEYLTYVMWAITPEGRATNVGEILLGWRQDQTGRHHGVAVVRLDCHRRALFRGNSTQRRGRHGELRHGRIPSGRLNKSTRSTSCYSGASTP